MRLTPGLQVLKGRRCMLVEDSVSNRFPEHSDIVPISYNQRRAIFCSRRHLNEVRQHHQDIPVYGIWQVIFATHKEWSSQLAVIYFDAVHQDGMALLYQDNVFSSCRIKAGKAICPMPLDMADAELIDMDIETCVIPSEPILTVEERETFRRVRLHRWLGFVGTATVSAFMMFFIGTMWLDYLNEHKIAQEHSYLRDRQELKQEYVQLRSQRLAHWPQQWHVLHPLAQLAEQSIPFEVWSIQFGQQTMRLKLQPMVAGMGYFPQWLEELPQVQFMQKKQGGIEVSWSNAAKSVQ